ncbi:type II CRISPR RNA-guided endonuclease Cas9, partial [Mycoplasma marinum]
YIKDHTRLNGTFNRTIHQNEYLKEINIILGKQDFLLNSTKDKFIKLFTRQRSFEEGPGVDPIKKGFNNLNDISKWSRWADDPKNPYDTIWSKTVGKCSLFPSKTRHPKKSLTSEIFNLLNDLNNITIDGQKLTKEDKQKLVFIALKVKSNSKKIMDKIKKLFELEDYSLIKGYRIDKSNKPLFTPLESLYEINKIIGFPLEDLINDFKYNQDNVFDNISEILFSTQTIEQRIIKLQDLNFGLSPEQLNQLAKLKGFAQTHSFSKKAMTLMIDTLIVEPINQMEWIYKNRQEDFQSIKTDVDFSIKWIDNIIDTPTVKRSLRQSIKILKAIFQYCGSNNLDVVNVVVEMARENNNKAARINETNRGKYFEEFNKQVESFAGGKISRKSGLFTKIWLLEQQGCKDGYTGEYIDKEDVIANPGWYDIDHIIPYSISFDNSRSNKILTKQQTNQSKLNQTPYQFLSSVEFEKMSKLWSEWYIPFKGMEKEKSFLKDKQKFEFLTSKLDFSDPENQLGFLQRNLVDTRYTTRELIKHLSDISKNNDKYNFKVKTINGKMTSYVRRKIETNRTYRLERPSNIPQEQFDPKTGKKNRIWHGHHAEDAYIVTVINKHYGDSKAVEKILSQPALRFEKINSSSKKYTKQAKAFITSEFAEFEKSIDLAGLVLNEKMEDMTFSRMKITKKNIQLFNETLYGGKIIDGKLYKVSKINIVEAKKDELKKWFDKHSKNTFIDQKTINELKRIYLNFENEKQPFKVANNNGKYIEVNGQKIRQLKYIASEKAQDGIIQTHESGDKISFYESLKSTEWWVYKDIKDKYQVIAINSLNAKFTSKGMILKNDVFKEQLKNKNINPEFKRELKLVRGSILENPVGERFFVVGYSESSGKKIEYKSLTSSLNVPNRPKGSADVIFNKMKMKVVNIDLLGDKK